MIHFSFLHTFTYYSSRSYACSTQWIHSRSTLNTLEEIWLCTSAIHILHMFSSTSMSKVHSKRDWRKLRNCKISRQLYAPLCFVSWLTVKCISQLLASNCSLSITPRTGTKCSPGIVQTHLNSTLFFSSTSQANFTFAGTVTLWLCGNNKQHVHYS